MTRPRTPEPGAGPAVERYLAEVTARLPGPARAHAGIVAELRSGLMDAQDAQRSAGLPPGQAGAAAISEFGDPAQIADAFRPGLAATQARRVVVMLLVTGPLVGLLWIAEGMAGHLGIHPRLSWQWAGLSPGFRLVAVAVGVTACAALAGIAATGRLSRWLPAGPRRAPTAAAIAGFGAMGADGLGLALLAAQIGTAPGAISPVLAAVAAAASLARLMLAGRAARRCLATRASLA